MNKQYLPSKQFIARLVILALIAGLAFGIYELTLYLKNRPARNKAQTGLVVRDIVQKDSNKNGIADWEETLWGLDPTKNGDSNKEFIITKREFLARSEDASMQTAFPSTKENELLSQEFFAVVISLQQTGNLDQDSMDAISEAIGSKIVATPIPDAYAANMLIIEDKENEAMGIIQYYTDFIDLNTKYSNKSMGNELSFIATALKNNDQSALNVAKGVGDAYAAFSRDLLKIPVPSSLASIHLSLANNYNKVAQSIDGLSQLLKDPIAGMKALINYNKYTDMASDDIQKLTDSLN